jgi:DNA-binding PadR family transcriptional regulator
MNMYFDEGPRWFAGGGRMRGGRGRDRGRGRGGPPFGDRPPWARGIRELFEERPVRADRGVVRYLVLDAVKDEPRHGYEIMAAIETKSRNAYRPSAGVVYPTLQMLEELGHLRVTEKDGKRVFSITAAGTRELEEHKAEVDGFYEESGGIWEDRPDDLADLGMLVHRLVRAFRRGARRGHLTREAMAKARAILEEAVGKLEALLDDEP